MYGEKEFEQPAADRRTAPLASAILEAGNTSPKLTPALLMGVQVVGYETAPGGEREHAALFLTGGGSVTREPLEPGRELSYRLDGRHCAGDVTQGQHTPCDREGVPYCDRHTSRWACARCTGECDLPLPSCREEHAVYLAAFAPATFKVGVTRSWRLDTRLREQGADRGARVVTVPDGRIAREREAEIAESITDRVRVPTKRAGLYRSVDTEAWNDLLASYGVADEDRYGFDYGLALRDQPVTETIAAGTVRGVKGRLVVLDRAGSTYAVDLRDLVGHEITPGAGSRDLQASLGAWE